MGALHDHQSRTCSGPAAGRSSTASTSGLRFTESAQVGYAAAKAGVIQLSKVVAVQHASDGALFLA
jgi:NAD(P)-dependent dehydrogenase (short-subunit alcohol dehydrogenase family)